MNPIFTWIISHTVGKALARRCPKCRREQIIPQEKAKNIVTCEHCGTPLPPPRTSTL